MLLINGVKAEYITRKDDDVLFSECILQLI